MNNQEFIEGVEIIGRNMPQEEKTSCSIGFDEEKILFGDPDWIEEKDDALRLREIGWFVEDDSWCFIPNSDYHIKENIQN